MPVHPWQLDHVVRTLWAPELETGRIVELGEDSDWYLPAQPVRAMCNVDSPGRAQVSLPLRILDIRRVPGIPPHCSLTAPLITRCLQGLWSRDKLLAEWGTVLLGEFASVTVRRPHLERAGDVPYQWLETLGCIWREPIERDDADRLLVISHYHGVRSSRPRVARARRTRVFAGCVRRALPRSGGRSPGGPRSPCWTVRPRRERRPPARAG
jgi:siderophore synthetase component